MTIYWKGLLVSVLLTGALGAIGCGSLATTESGGADNLPVSGAGPFTKLASPVVLSEAGFDLDDADLLTKNGLLGLWYTRTDAMGTSEIHHVDFTDLAAGPIPPGDLRAIFADEPWERGSVAQPAVLLDDEAGGHPFLLFYAAAGFIGYATSPDSHFWEKAPGPSLLPLDVEGPLSSPAAVVLGDGTVRLYYVGSGGLYAADARRDDLDHHVPQPFTRRGLVVGNGAAAWLPTVGRTTARSVVTPAGRDRFDLLLTGDVGGRSVVGFAGSFDGAYFSFADAPLLDPKAPDESSPTMVEWSGSQLLFFTQTANARRSILAATAP